MATTAPVTWAQRKDALYITIAVPDIGPDAKIDLQPGHLVFSGTSNGKPYAANLEFFAEVDPSNAASKYEIKPRNIQFHLIKKDVDAEFWPRLLKDKSKEKGQISIDWTRFADEDEAEEKGGFDTSMFGSGAQGFGGGGEDDYGMGGPGGMGGMGGMPGGMGGMGGMMGGMGGPGGFDMAKLQAMMGGAGGMGGMPGMGGAGGMDFSNFGAGGPDGDDDGGEADSDDDLPDLEQDEEAPKAAVPEGTA